MVGVFLVGRSSMTNDQQGRDRWSNWTRRRTSTLVDWKRWATGPLASLFFSLSETWLEFFSGWWFGTFFIFHILGKIIPTDFHIFQTGRYTTNQLFMIIFNHIFSMSGFSWFFLGHHLYRRDLCPLCVYMKVRFPEPHPLCLPAKTIGSCWIS